jgi:putative transposase
MSQKRNRPEEIIAKLREAEVLLGQGQKVPEAVKAIGVSEVSYYRLAQGVHLTWMERVALAI